VNEIEAEYQRKTARQLRAIEEHFGRPSPEAQAARAERSSTEEIFAARARAVGHERPSLELQSSPTAETLFSAEYSAQVCARRGVKAAPHADEGTSK
jgi:hypothetical protein